MGHQIYKELSEKKLLFLQGVQNVECQGEVAQGKGGI